MQEVYDRDHVGSVVDAFAVTPHDTNELTFWARALYVGTTGHLTLTLLDDSDVVFSNVPVGWFPVQCKKVKTATTASNIVAVR